MSKYANQLLPPPFAMRSYSDPTALAPTESSLIQGFWAAREGVLRCPSPIQNIPISPARTVLGFAWYTDRRTPETAPWNTRSRLLVFYEAGTTGLGYYTVEIWQLDGNGNAKKPTTYSFSDPGYFGGSGELAEVEPIPRARPAPVRWVQNEEELFYVWGSGSYPRRFWLDDAGAPHCFLLGVMPPSLPVSGGDPLREQFYLLPGFMAGNLQQGVTYKYRIYLGDNKFRLSDASEDNVGIGGGHDTSIVLTYPKTSTKLSIPRISDAEPGKQGTYLYIARAAQGTDTYYFINPRNVSGIPYTDGYYTLPGGYTQVELYDTASEAELITGDLAPLPGENGIPVQASMLALQGNRLWTDDRTYGQYQRRIFPPWLAGTTPVYTDAESLTRIWASNLTSYGQFNQVANPTREDLGSALQIGSEEGGRVSGLASYGATLGVWKTDGQWLITGNSASDWIINYAHNKGCVSPDSIGRVKGVTYFMSHDGIWGENSDATMPIPVSIPVTDYLTRYDGGVVQPPPIPYTAFDPAVAKGGGLQEDETKVNAWYPLPQNALASSLAYVQDGRYYISIPTREACLCLDPSAPIASADQSVPAYYRMLDVSMGWAEMGFVPSVAMTFKEEGWGDRLIATGSIREPWDPLSGSTVPVVTQHMALNLDSPGAYSPWTKRVRIGPFDGLGNDRAHRKQAISLTIFGSFRNNDTPTGQQQVGEISLTTDTGRTEKYPIIPVLILGATVGAEQPRIMPGGTIWRQKFTPSMRGLVLQAEIALWSPECTIDNAILEYVPLDVDPMPVGTRNAT